MHDNPASPEQPAGPPDVMQFPMTFPLKVMGRNDPGFIETITEIIKRHAPDFDPAHIETRLSRDDTYLSMTATFSAQSRAQLDALYRELSGHPKVSVVL